MKEESYIRNVKYFLEELIRGCGIIQKENPAVQFTKDAKAGLYDNYTDEVYNSMLKDIEDVAKFWHGKKYETVYNLFQNALSGVKVDSEDMWQIAKILTRSCENSMTARYKLEKPAPKNEEEPEWEDFEDEELIDAFEEEKQMTPKEIYRYVSSQILGQEEAVKAASMLLYNHLHGKKRNVLFAGPTGCGKTEIWRVLSQLYPNIQIVDGTMITMEGWSGAFKLRDIFANMSREQAESAIVVIDEFDKLCEPKYGSGGNNYSAAMQNELLKMIEGNKVFFPEDKGKVAMEFDTSKISFVFCGSFETLITRKREINSSIGFGKSIDKSDISVEYKNKIKTEDLMTYAGVRREICGRINQVVQLRPMTAEDYKQILQHYSMSPVRKLEKEYHIRLKLNREMQDILAKEAEENQMGVRYLNSRIQELLDEQMFLDSEKEEYLLEA